MADSKTAKQRVCVKLCVRARSEVPCDQETVRDRETFRDIQAETELLGLSGQRRDTMTLGHLSVRRCLLTLPEEPIFYPSLTVPTTAQLQHGEDLCGC